MTASIQEHLAAKTPANIPPIVSFNGLINAEEAAKILGCSYSYTVQLLKKKKIKGQKKNKTWLVDADDVYKAKNSGLVRSKKPGNTVPSSVVPTAIRITTTLQLEIDQNKYDIVNSVFHFQGKSLESFLLAQVEDLYNKVSASLKSVEL